ncbi:MAG: hypothetical protein EBR89_07645 [Betaproteobacteria bacterium]|nr:hypothetical protein [Betaproteobacteria bacterium]
MVIAPDFALLLQPLLDLDSPVFPPAPVRQVWVHVLWGVVLAAAGWRLASVLQPPWRLAWAALVGIGSSLPGPLSPAYWLELAFASPSWTSVLLCGLWLWQQTRSHVQAGDLRTTSASHPIPLPWVLCGIAMGWVLALDTFAALPIPHSIYALGLSPLASLILMVAAAATWVLSARWVHALPLVVLALFVLTRLPSGNVWDAVLDPLLWLYLHIHLAGRGWRSLRAR